MTDLHVFVRLAVTDLRACESLAVADLHACVRVAVTDLRACVRLAVADLHACVRVAVTDLRACVRLMPKTTIYFPASPTFSILYDHSANDTNSRNETPLACPV